MHIPSLDDEDMPVLQVAKAEHQPQLAADVQSKHDVSELQVSGGGGGGGGAGTEPVENAVQLKTDSTGSVVHIEFATPQLLLMVLKRVLEVMYAIFPLDDVRTTLQPNDKVAVPWVELDNEMLTAWKLTRANVESAAQNS
jgi:hypothetical protein